MQVRRATLDDVPRLVGLQPHVHDLHVHAEPHLYRPADPAEVAAWFRDVLADPDMTVLLAGDVGDVVCRAVRRPANPFSPALAYLLVDQLVVAPAARRSGVGRALMRAAEELARELGLSHVELDVRAVNAEARAFYEALGYAPVQLRLASPALARAP